MFCWHKWSKWGDLVPSSGGGSVSQFSSCSKCGAIKRKTAIGFNEPSFSIEAIKKALVNN